MLNGKPLLEIILNTKYLLALFSCNYRHMHYSDFESWGSVALLPQPPRLSIVPVIIEEQTRTKKKQLPDRAGV